MSMPRAVIIGGSVGGLLAANLLRGAGWGTTVYERSSAELSARGAGLGTQEQFFAILNRIGVRPDEALVCHVRSRLCLAPNGRVVGEIPIGSITTSWDAVWRALRCLLPDECYRSGMSIDHIAQSDRSATAIFADGSRTDADLIVAADGLFSTVRRQMLPEVAPHYAGYVAFRAAVSERDVPSKMREQIFNHMIFCFPGHGVTLAVPMARHAGSRSDGRRTHIVWFRSVMEEPELRAHFTDSSGFCHGRSIAPTLIRRELIDLIKREARTMLPPQLSCLFEAAPLLLLQAIHDLESPRMAFGRVALLGDAAFTARPHAGTGVTKAALDAEALVCGLEAAGNVVEGVDLYERQRLQDCHALVERGRNLGRLVERLAQTPCSTRSSFDVDFRPLVSQLGAAGQAEAAR